MAIVVAVYDDYMLDGCHVWTIFIPWLGDLNRYMNGVFNRYMNGVIYMAIVESLYTMWLCAYCHFIK